MTAHSPIPGVLNDREMLGVQQAFGVSEVSFDRVPASATWHDDLAHQCAPQVTAAEAVEIVRDVWKHA